MSRAGRGGAAALAALAASLVLLGGCGGSPGALPPEVTSPPGSPVTAVPATAPPSEAANKVPSRGPGTRLGPWKLRDRFFVLSALSDQGLASVSRNGKTILIFRGQLSIPQDLRGEGWVHVGDPGRWHGDVVDAYQSDLATPQKLFSITFPTGERDDFLHYLVAGEEANNSFAAVTPDGQWMVSGEYGLMRRLLVFPTPALNDRAPPGMADLPLVATITLDHPVRNVQGCTFDGTKALLCSTNDPGTDLWPTPDQLLSITLPGPVKGAPLRAHVRSLGQLPLLSQCRGDFEVEGLDLQADRKLLRVEVRPPGRCGFATAVYEYEPVSG